MMQKFSHAIKRNAMGRCYHFARLILIYSLCADYAVFYQENIRWSQGLGQNIH